MGIIPQAISQDEFEAIEWLPLLDGVDVGRDRWGAASRLMDRAQELEVAGQAKTASVLRLLGGAMSMQLHHDTRAPFGPMIQMHGRRSMSMEDIEEHDVAVLAMAARSAGNPWLRARFSDLAITVDRRRPPDWELGRVAVDAYVDYIASVFGTERAIDGLDECQRVLNLFWAYAKRDEALWKRIWDLITGEVAHSASQNWPGLVFALCEEALSRSRDACAAIVPTIEAKATDLDAASPDEAARYHRAAARLWNRLRDLPKANASLVAQGEATARAAMAASEHNPILAPNLMVEAISILRRAKASPARVNELRELLSNYERASLDAYHGHEFKTDVSDWVAWIDEQIVGPTLFEALLQVAFKTGKWLDAEAIEDSVRENSAKHPLSTMFGYQQANDEGAIVATQEALDLNNPASVYAYMVQQAKQVHLDARAQVLVNRVTDLLYSNYQVQFFEIKEIVEASPMTPAQHAETLARGLYYGITNDWLAAAVYLIPAMEPFIRDQIKRTGAHTTVIREGGTQQERTLSELLEMDEAKKLFGKGLMLELRTLLTEPLGFNLRHLYAHGLLSDGQMQNAGIMSLWWCLWRMILFPWHGHPALQAPINRVPEAPGQSA